MDHPSIALASFIKRPAWMDGRGDSSHSALDTLRYRGLCVLRF
jgi:hypothetical protein